MAKSMMGREIDMNKLAASNWNVRAVGNANMNARGDQVDRHGHIVKQREQIDKELESYHRENPNAVRSFSALDAEVFASPADVYKASPTMIPAAVEATVVAPADKVAVPAAKPTSKKIVNND